MTVFRLADRKYPPDSSEGSRRKGGRWNLKGDPVIYASATRALAACEVIAHVGFVPENYQVIGITIPDDLQHEKLDADLPRDWSDNIEFTAKAGSLWVKHRKTAVLSVPSVLFPEERNYIINPAHPEFQRIQFRIGKEAIDPRLRKIRATL